MAADISYKREASTPPLSEPMDLSGSKKQTDNTPRLYSKHNTFLNISNRFIVPMLCYFCDVKFSQVLSMFCE